MSVLNSNTNRNPLKRRPLRLPGQSDAEKISSLQMDIAFYIVVALFFVFLAFLEWWRWYRNLPPNPILFLCLALIAVPLIYYQVRRLLIEKGHWEQGLQGEIEVGQYLEQLRAKGYTIFHDIQCVPELVVKVYWWFSVLWLRHIQFTFCCPPLF